MANVPATAATCDLPDAGAPAVDKTRRNHLAAYGVTGFFLFLTLAAIGVNELYVYFAAYLWFGFIYGMCLQGGRFCFSSAIFPAITLWMP